MDPLPKTEGKDDLISSRSKRALQWTTKLWFADLKNEEKCNYRAVVVIVAVISKEKSVG